MTPSNPNNNNQPLIYRICDALGVFHIVAPVDHHHSQAEIDGLQSALMNKADANRTEIELNKKIDKVLSATIGDIAVFDIDGGVEDSGTKVSDLQPKLTFDTIPIANSANPVTSGGVKIALDDKQDTLTFDNTPTANSNNPVKSGGIYTALAGKSNEGHTHTALDVQGLIPSFLTFDGGTFDLDGLITTEEGLARVCIQNSTSGHVTFDDLFYSGDAVPVHVNMNGGVHIDPNYYVIATIYKIDKSLAPDHEHELCYFIELNGIFNDGN